MEALEGLQIGNHYEHVSVNIFRTLRWKHFAESYADSHGLETRVKLVVGNISAISLLMQTWNYKVEAS